MAVGVSRKKVGGEHDDDGIIKHGATLTTTW